MRVARIGVVATGVAGATALALVALLCLRGLPLAVGRQGGAIEEELNDDRGAPDHRGISDRRLLAGDVPAYKDTDVHARPQDFVLQTRSEMSDRGPDGGEAKTREVAATREAIQYTLERIEKKEATWRTYESTCSA